MVQQPESNVLIDTQSRLSAIYERLETPDAVRKRLSEPKRVVETPRTSRRVPWSRLPMGPSDVLVNAGGTTVSYFEWVQNRSGDYWLEGHVNKRLSTKLAREAEQCFQIAD